MTCITDFADEAGQWQVATGCGPMADGQKDYLQGTIEFYQARTNTKRTIPRNGSR